LGGIEVGVREILQLGDLRLWQPSEAVSDPGSWETRQVIEDLAATLSDFRLRYQFGRAIAAPQINAHRRIIFTNVGEPKALINPEIVFRSEEMMELWDDCFSFPNLMVRVRRHFEIGIRYLDTHGAVVALRASGDLSELLQHEIDHLDGILATDRAINQRSFSLRSEVEKRINT
jgi:peptide deformylase